MHALCRVDAGCQFVRWCSSSVAPGRSIEEYLMLVVDKVGVALQLCAIFARLDIVYVYPTGYSIMWTFCRASCVATLISGLSLLCLKTLPCMLLMNEAITRMMYKLSARKHSTNIRVLYLSWEITS